jgi:hypothetical protein
LKIFIAWFLPVDGCPVKAVKKIGDVLELIVVIADWSINKPNVLNMAGTAYSIELLALRLKFKKKLCRFFALFI